MASAYHTGVDDFVGFFPLPSTFVPAVMTDHVFFVRDGDFGLRKVYPSGWRVGGTVKPMALGYTSNQSPILFGMSRRDWSLQGGITAGKTFGRLAVDVGANTDITGAHDGQEYSFKIAMPFSGERWNFVPQIGVRYQSDDIVNYYYGVTPPEATPGRPEYTPGSALIPRASVTLSYRFNPRWYMRLKASLDFTPDEITMSPIVDVDNASRIFVGIAYDAPVFTEFHESLDPFDHAKFELTLGAFFATMDSNTQVRNPLLGNFASNTKVKDDDVYGLVDGKWRFTSHHRIEFSYFSLDSDATFTPVQPIDLRDTIFIAGDPMRAQLETKALRIGYAFSLQHDDQKELSVFGGVGITEVEFHAANSTENVSFSTNSTLPALGAQLRLVFKHKLSAEVKIEFLDMNFGKHDGSMMDFRLNAQYQMFERAALGIGYIFFRQDVDSGDESFPGDYAFTFSGPVAFIRARF
jgi:outer membrane protein